MATKLQPMPEMMARRDIAIGNWHIGECKPVRGEPYTNIVERKMVVPQGNENSDRLIRAHEMMHARVSPADDFGNWIARGIASENALIAVEEARVNFLVKKAGFDVSELSDGSEVAAGTLLADKGDWAGCVYTAVGYMMCGGAKDFLTGVRRVNRAWGATLKDITKRIEKELEKAYKQGTLGSTAIDQASGLYPYGFSHTERLAEWVDRLANPPKQEDEDDPANDGDAERDENPQQTSQSKDGGEGMPKNKGKEKKEKPAPVDPDKVNPYEQKNAIPKWGDLKVKRLPMTRHARGGLGKKRIASPYGKNPRRIQNALVDPQKRVFDQHRRGKGGVVLIDGSGSMRLKHEQILKITEAAPGCTVAIYSADALNRNDNLWILAENGKMVASVPERNGGNGVDGEAIRWAIKQRKHSSTPVVWVTDGKVHGLANGGGITQYNDALAMDCIKEVLRNKVHMAPTVDEGIEILKALGSGRAPKRWFPRRWVETYERLNGRRLA